MVPEKKVKTEAELMLKWEKNNALKTEICFATK